MRSDIWIIKGISAREVRLNRIRARLGEGVELLKKKTAAFCLGMLLGLIIICIVSTPLHLFDPRILSGFFLAPQEMPNAAPQVIPSLREWQGGYGSFAMRSPSHIVIDPAY